MKKENLVEETIVQLQNLEDVINENAKEILASTMEKEISELVKESMQDETGLEDDMLEQSNIEDTEEEMDDEEMSDDSEEELDMDLSDMEDMEDESEDEMEMDFDMEDDSEEMDMSGDFGDEETIDLTDASDEEILKVFKSMTDDDSISITKDGDYIHLTDDEDEYLIQAESEEDMFEGTEYELDEQYNEEDEEEFEYEIDESYMENMDEEEEKEMDEVVYEIEMEEGDDEFFGDSDMVGGMEDEETEEGYMNENKHFAFAKGFKTETKESMKPKVGKGAKTGSAKKDIYGKDANMKGFKEDMPQGTKGVGMGKAKFEYKESKKGMKKGEFKEAARTLGNGKKWGRNGLDKPKAAPRHLAIESLQNEVEMLRNKNEEYRKALNLFREKLNEVAVFNSNLAYATRLFTEHSTSKQEKINILRRFDTADTLKESKALYKSIKDELSTDNNKKFVNESIETAIEKAPKSGSAINLIESKTYENPQFMRMKDIMSKIIK